MHPWLLLWCSLCLDICLSRCPFTDMCYHVTLLGKLSWASPFTAGCSERQAGQITRFSLLTACSLPCLRRQIMVQLFVGFFQFCVTLMSFCIPFPHVFLKKWTTHCMFWPNSCEWFEYCIIISWCQTGRHNAKGKHSSNETDLSLTCSKQLI